MFRNVVLIYLIATFIFTFIPSLSYSATRIIKDELATFDGVRLSAFWTIPNNSDTPIAALILQGSGNVGADGDVSSPFVGFPLNNTSAKLSEQLADQLALSGVPSLRYSKRGFEDPNQAPNQVIPYLKKDAQTAIAQIRSKFKGAKIILIGFSEGATIASMVAAEDPSIDYLFLMAPPTRNIQEVVEYQFKAWGLRVAKNELDLNQDGFIDSTEYALKPDAKFPLVGTAFQPASFEELDQNHDGVLDINNELTPAYQKTYAAAQILLRQPAFQNWYESMLAVPSFSNTISKVRAQIFIYQGESDSQIDPEWIKSDRKYINANNYYYRFQNLGHCFSPLTGSIGEIKTSGPLDRAVLTVLRSDLKHLRGAN